MTVRITKISTDVHRQLLEHSSLLHSRRMFPKSGQKYKRACAKVCFAHQDLEETQSTANAFASAASSSTHIPGDTAQQMATPGHGEKHVNPVPDTSMDDEHATREAIFELFPSVTSSRQCAAHAQQCFAAGKRICCTNCRNCGGAKGGRSSGSGLFRGSRGWKGGTRISFPLEFVVFKVAGFGGNAVDAERDEEPRGYDVYCDENDGRVREILFETSIMLTRIDRMKYFEVGRPNGRVVVDNKCLNSWSWRWCHRKKWVAARMFVHSRWFVRQSHSSSDDERGNRDRRDSRKHFAGGHPEMRLRALSGPRTGARPCETQMDEDGAK